MYLVKREFNLAGARDYSVTVIHNAARAWLYFARLWEAFAPYNYRVWLEYEKDERG